MKKGKRERKEGGGWCGWRKRGRRESEKVGNSVFFFLPFFFTIFFIFTVQVGFFPISNLVGCAFFFPLAFLACSRFRPGFRFGYTCNIRNILVRLMTFRQVSQATMVHRTPSLVRFLIDIMPHELCRELHYAG